MTHAMATHVSYVLITDAHSRIAKAKALDLAQSNQHLLLIGKPHEGLMEWAHQLMMYGVEVDFFETDCTDLQNLGLLADWIHASYPVSRFLNLAEISWMEEIFHPMSFEEKRVA